MEQTILDENEAALVTEGDTLKLLLPAFEGDDPVPDLMIFLTACMMRFEDDPEFFEQMVEWFSKQLRVH